MNDQEALQGPDTSVHDSRQAAGLRLEGFEAGEGIWDFTPKFTLDELLHSMATSTYSNPVPVELDLGLDGLTPIRVVVQKIESIFMPFEPGINDGALGCDERPYWKLEGWVMKSGFDPYTEVIRVRACASLDPNEVLNTGRGQRIPTNPDPDGVLRWAPISLM